MKMTINLRVGLAALAAVAALAVGGARADDAAKADPSAQYAPRIFAGHFDAKGKSYACFARRYDAAHLARHPKQTVKRMILLVKSELLPEDKILNYSFGLRFAFRDRKGTFDSAGDCGHVGPAENAADRLQLGCGVDCDGGGLTAELVNNDKQLRVSIDSIAIWNSKSKGDIDDRDGLNAGADDHVFLLERTGLDECRPLMDDDDKPASM
jgi:hypothetical protein